MLAFNSDCFIDHKKYFQMWLQLHFTSYLIHKKNIFFIISGSEFCRAFIIQRPEIKSHENHETPVPNANYKNCQKLNNAKLKFKK